MSTLLILGAGGHGLVVADAALCMGTWTRICFLDDRHGTVEQPLGLEVIGNIADLELLNRDFDAAVVAIGNNGLRLRLLRACMDLCMRTPPIVHPHASVSPFATLGPGTVVCARAVINPVAVIGAGGIVNTGATVDHGCRLADGVHIAPGAHIGGDVKIGERSWIGIGACVKHGIEIGADVMVGAGAAVVSNLPSGVVATGVPAKTT